METLADGSKVGTRCYDFVVDFNNENDWKLMHDLYNVRVVSELSRHQFVYLFRHAMDMELKALK